MSKPIYVLSGPNLNLLGVREPHIYGKDTLDDVRAACERRAQTLGRSIVFRQSNHEGVLIDWIQEARTEASALVINPAAYGHTSIALLDALKAADIPVVECHLSNPAARETFRHHTYVSLAATGLVSGFGLASYELAVEAAARLSA
ncbi:MAG TPA: type II 3-dehydroquinate dehydratase [Phenylobacterium sp.]|nr:type II 3-dehydroquinate dehydratase [Phenylobacterium sp.]HMP61979.1 type II 3-dehydroquinate dehydratase [Phenylobacterium sp.]